MTGIRPSDWDHRPPLEVKLEDPRSFDFKSLSESEHLIVFSGVVLISIADSVLRNSLAKFVLEYTFTGKIRLLDGPIGSDMVEYGVSRFTRKDLLAETDEPLAILALVTHAEKALTLEDYLRDSLSVASPVCRGIAFEAFGAYLLARAFSEPKRLSEIFEFVEGGKKANKALEDAVAVLATLEKDGDKFHATPLQIETNRRSRHVLGRSPSSAAGTLEWLQNPQGSAFCYPANTVGPDLIFVLKLPKDRTVLRVCVQFKHTEQLSPEASQKAIRTTEPSFFFSQKKKGDKSPTCSNPSMRANVEEAIKNLGKGTRKAGPCGLLGVVCSHPSLLDSNTLEEEAAKGKHPLATLPVSFLEWEDSDLSQTILSLAKEAIQVSDQNRNSSDEIEGAIPKKQKIEIDPEIGGSMKGGSRNRSTRKRK